MPDYIWCLQIVVAIRRRRLSEGDIIIADVNYFIEVWERGEGWRCSLTGHDGDCRSSLPEIYEHNEREETQQRGY